MIKNTFKIKRDDDIGQVKRSKQQQKLHQFSNINGKNSTK